MQYDEIPSWFVETVNIYFNSAKIAIKHKIIW